MKILMSCFIGEMLDVNVIFTVAAIALIIFIELLMAISCKNEGK